ncbi:nucleoside hydrolase [Scleromatobacter humisilvae]|uniref:Nucleoside hydrolase n=1 Tax=Scleromatobacter humisilvae TaxID=2897159 RepID=A0A9X2BXU4_9BURK|nr:nucleoside hydrolase [Scleromatobacter humisilvae]MCK9684722.1 nucleoside hydrolase [Scleromatobacter humisilvae]
MLLKLRLCALIALSLAAGFATADDSHRGRDPAPPKVILDTDFNTISDDGQALAMLAQLDAAGKLDLLGVTVATGNAWLEQETSDALKAVERLGIDRSVGVYVGAKYPLLHDYDAYLDEVARFGAPIDYVGAFASPPPTSPGDIVAPPDGFATHTRPQRQHAVDFLIEQIHRYPHQVSILEIAPPTNLAMAIRKDPGIVPLIKQVVTMAGQIYVAGNAYNDVAEFNWWTDPESVKIVLRAAVPKVILPLDLTNDVPLTKPVYLQIANHRPVTPITKLYTDAYAPFFGSAPAPYPLYIWDTTALAYLVDPTFATSTRDLWVDMSTTFDANYGKSIVYDSNPTPTIPLLQPSKVVFAFDTARFYAFYVDLLTRPVPVHGGR